MGRKGDCESFAAIGLDNNRTACDEMRGHIVTQCVTVHVRTRP